MATVTGTMAQPAHEAMTAAQVIAGQQGYALAEPLCGPTRLVFSKGMTLVSWGSKLIVDFQRTSPTSMRLTITTSETFALSDWGRGKRAAQKLLDALGAT